MFMLSLLKKKRTIEDSSIGRFIFKMIREGDDMDERIIYIYK